MTTRATVAAMREKLLDPSGALSVHAERIDETGRTWLTVDMRRGVDEAVRLTVDATELLRVVFDALTLVDGRWQCAWCPRGVAVRE